MVSFANQKFKTTFKRILFLDNLQIILKFKKTQSHGFPQKTFLGGASRDRQKRLPFF